MEKIIKNMVTQFLQDKKQLAIILDPMMAHLKASIKMYYISIILILSLILFTNICIIIAVLRLSNTR